MSVFNDLIVSDIRLVILRALSEDPGYSHNEIILKEILGVMGHKVASDGLRAQLAWLAEQGLVETEAVGNLAVARLTSRGADVADGSATCPGVKRPRPGV